MENPTRRGFIQGLISAVGAGMALVTLAKPEEVQALALREPVGLTQVVNPVFGFPGFGDDGLAYMKVKGQFMPVGYVTDIKVSSAIDDIMSLDGSIVGSFPMLKEIHMRFSNRR